MSLDYPNRKDWLAVRNTPRSIAGCVFGNVLFNKGTFNDGRNKQKRRVVADAYERMTLLADRRLRQRRQVHPL